MIAHPIAQLSSCIGTEDKDGLDSYDVLSCFNRTEKVVADVPARSLKVATRVRIPLGLQIDLDP